MKEYISADYKNKHLYNYYVEFHKAKYAKVLALYVDLYNKVKVDDSIDYADKVRELERLQKEIDNITPLPKNVFLDIITEYNYRLQRELIAGRRVNLGARLGHVCVVEMNRNLKLNKKGEIIAAVNWGATRKLNERDKNGKYVKVYHTEDTYPHIHWEERNCTLKHRSSYMFHPARDFQLDLFEAYKKNPLLKLNYRRSK